MFPQLPQFSGSSTRYTQTPEHAVSPAGHGWHDEFWHTSPAAQAFPQAPQLALSLAVQIHVPLQFVWLHRQLQSFPEQLPLQFGSAA